MQRGNSCFRRGQTSLFDRRYERVFVFFCLSGRLLRQTNPGDDVVTSQTPREENQKQARRSRHRICAEIARLAATKSFAAARDLLAAVVLAAIALERFATNVSRQRRFL